MTLNSPESRDYDDILDVQQQGEHQEHPLNDKFENLYKGLEDGSIKPRNLPKIINQIGQELQSESLKIQEYFLDKMDVLMQSVSDSGDLGTMDKAFLEAADIIQNKYENSLNQAKSEMYQGMLKNNPVLEWERDGENVTTSVVVALDLKDTYGLMAYGPDLASYDGFQSMNAKGDAIKEAYRTVMTKIAASGGDQRFKMNSFAPTDIVRHGDKIYVVMSGNVQFEQIKKQQEVEKPEKENITSSSTNFTPHKPLIGSNGQEIERRNEPGPMDDFTVPEGYQVVMSPSELGAGPLINKETGQPLLEKIKKEGGDQGLEKEEIKPSTKTSSSHFTPHKPLIGSNGQEIERRNEPGPMDDFTVPEGYQVVMSPSELGGGPLINKETGQPLLEKINRDGDEVGDDVIANDKLNQLTQDIQDKFEAARSKQQDEFNKFKRESRSKFEEFTRRAEENQVKFLESQFKDF